MTKFFDCCFCFFKLSAAATKLPNETSPKHVLLEWSKTLQKTFIAGNVDRPGLSDNVMAHLRFMTERIDANGAEADESIKEVMLCTNKVAELQQQNLEKSSLLEACLAELKQSRATTTKLADTLLATAQALSHLQPSEMSPRKRKSIEQIIHNGILGSILTFELSYPILVVFIHFSKHLFASSLYFEDCIHGLSQLFMWSLHFFVLEAQSFLKEIWMIVLGLKGILSLLLFK